MTLLMGLGYSVHKFALVKHKTTLLLLYVIMFNECPTVVADSSLGSHVCVPSGNPIIE